jgi:ATP-dependent HslUV protease ATP-binding subunit HslU
MRNEVTPKNILMIGPTGVGKTEIARRLAKLCDAPFVKVEATKYTEVGFHGKDVDEMIKDLVDASIKLLKARRRQEVRKQVEPEVEKRLIELLIGTNPTAQAKAEFVDLLREGKVEAIVVKVNVPSDVGGDDDQGGGGGVAMFGIPPNVQVRLRGGMGGGLGAALGALGQLGGGPRKSVEKQLSVAEARKVLTDVECDKLLSNEDFTRDAIKLAEQDGIVVIDEIDKICSPKYARDGKDASAEGVQRDLLPLVEGSVVATKHGNVDTSHILFIASGAFSGCKPSDMLPELQGRLPIKVEYVCRPSRTSCRCFMGFV